MDKRGSNYLCRRPMGSMDCAQQARATTSLTRNRADHPGTWKIWSHSECRETSSALPTQRQGRAQRAEEILAEKLPTSTWALSFPTERLKIPNCSAASKNRVDGMQCSGLLSWQNELWACSTGSGSGRQVFCRAPHTVWVLLEWKNSAAGNGLKTPSSHRFTTRTCHTCPEHRDVLQGLHDQVAKRRQQLHELATQDPTNICVQPVAMQHLQEIELNLRPQPAATSSLIEEASLVGEQVPCPVCGAYFL